MNSRPQADVIAARLPEAVKPRRKVSAGLADEQLRLFEERRIDRLVAATCKKFGQATDKSVPTRQFRGLDVDHIDPAKRFYVHFRNIQEVRRGVFRLSRRFLPVQLYSAIAGTYPRANIPPYYAGVHFDRTFTVFNNRTYMETTNPSQDDSGRSAGV